MKALVVYNPFSGKQKLHKNLDYLKEKLSLKYDVDVFCSCGEKSITNYLIDNAKNYDLIVTSGGDGTMNETVTGILKSNSSPALAYIPAGTMNDLAHMLELKKNIKKAVNIILNGEVAHMDVCKVNDSYFTYAAAAGKYTDISYKANHGLKKVFGKGAYYIQMIPEFSKRTKMNLKLTFEKQVVEGTYYVVLVLNTIRVGGFKFYRRKRVLLDDGIIDVTLIRKHHVTWPRLLNFFLRGDKAKDSQTYHTNHFTIESDEKIQFNTDGEFSQVDDHFEIKVLKKALKIVVPKHIKETLFKSK